MEDDTPGGVDMLHSVKAREMGVCEQPKGKKEEKNLKTGLKKA